MKYFVKLGEWKLGKTLERNTVTV